MRPRLARTAQALEAPAQRVVPVVRRRVDLEQRLERLPRALVLAGGEVGPPQRLEDRALAGLQARGPLQHDRGLGVVAAAHQGRATLEQLVGGLGLVGRRVGGGTSSRTPRDAGTNDRIAPVRWTSRAERPAGAAQPDRLARPASRPRSPVTILRLSVALFLVQMGFHAYTASLPLALARAGRRGRGDRAHHGRGRGRPDPGCPRRRTSRGHVRRAAPVHGRGHPVPARVGRPAAARRGGRRQPRPLRARADAAGGRASPSCSRRPCRSSPAWWPPARVAQGLSDRRAPRRT